jgi:hypothetical protein
MMRYRWHGFLVFTVALCVAGFAQKGQVQDKSDPLAKPDPTIKAQNWQFIPITVAPRNPADYVPYDPRGDFFPASGGTVVYDVTGTPSYDSIGAPCNVRVSIRSPGGATHFSGIGWDVYLTAYPPSRLSDIAVLMANVNGRGYALVVGASDGSGGHYSSGGVVDWCGRFGVPPLELPDGNLYLEFFELYDNFPDCIRDGSWDIGTLTFAFDTPAPFTGYDEVGDAGDLPESAQATPSGALTGIRGTLSPGDVDMYAIYITNPSAFAASMRCNVLFDTQLFLFDANGNPVSFNDDAPEGDSASRLDGSCIPGPGLYYLAVSAYDRDAVDCNGAELWADTPLRAIRCADGPGSGRIGGWTGSHGVSATYIVSLMGAQGASPGDPADCPPPPADRWNEQRNGGGDAGDLPSNAQAVYRPDQTPCQSPVTRISGVRANTTDADMYVICITNPASFSASTIGLAGFDTQLWLFRCDGRGIVHNDNWADELQSRIDNSTGCLNGLQAGTYLLAVTGYDQNPVDSGGKLLWDNNPLGEGEIRCPDGLGASNPIAGWTGSGGSGNYGIALTGAYFVAQGGCEGGPGQCNGDANRDGRVDDADLLIVLFQFGQSGLGLQGDVNNDGTVDDADLLVVLFNFGCGS